MIAILLHRCSQFFASVLAIVASVVYLVIIFHLILDFWLYIALSVCFSFDDDNNRQDAAEKETKQPI